MGLYSSTLLIINYYRFFLYIVNEGIRFERSKILQAFSFADEGQRS